MSRSGPAGAMRDDAAWTPGWLGGLPAGEPKEFASGPSRNVALGLPSQSPRRKRPVRKVRPDHRRSEAASACWSSSPETFIGRALTSVASSAANLVASGCASPPTMQHRRRRDLSGAAASGGRSICGAAFIVAVPELGSRDVRIRAAHGPGGAEQARAGGSGEQGARSPRGGRVPLRGKAPAVAATRHLATARDERAPGCAGARPPPPTLSCCGRRRSLAAMLPRSSTAHRRHKPQIRCTLESRFQDWSASSRRRCGCLSASPRRTRRYRRSAGVQHRP